MKGYCASWRDAGRPSRRPSTAPLHRISRELRSHYSRWACVYLPVCMWFYSLWNKLLRQVHIAYSRIFSCPEEKLNPRVLEFLRKILSHQFSKAGLPGHWVKLGSLCEYTFFAGVTAVHELKITAMFLSKGFQNQSHFEIYYTTRGSNRILSWKALHKGNLYYLSFSSNVRFKIYIWDIHFVL